MATLAKRDLSESYTWELDQPDHQHLHIRVHVHDIAHWFEVGVYPARAGKSSARWEVSTGYTEVGTGNNISGGTEESRTYDAACRKAYALALKWLHDELGTGQKRPRRLP